LASFSATAQEGAEVTDPYQWLEDVEGERALAWVREQNARTEAELAADPAFKALEAELLAIYDSNEKIPGVYKQGEWYYNFWRDKDHERGIWRRTTLEEYRKAQPAWETVLDLDALNRAAGENWVWHGADCLPPNYGRGLVAPSRRGAGADAAREFAHAGRVGVEGGSQRAEAKGAMAWIDRHTVYAYPDFGDGSLTTSGYPRIVKEWKRGTPIEAATVA